MTIFCCGYIFLASYLLASSVISFSLKYSSISMERYTLKTVHIYSVANKQLVDIEIDKLVNERIEHRLNRNYIEADRIKAYLESHDIVLTDFPFKDGGKSIWRHRRRPISPETGQGDGVMDTIRQISNLSKSGRNDDIQDLIQKCKSRLNYFFNKSTNPQDDVYNEDYYHHEMQGRKFADAAFELAMAGVDDMELYSLFVEGTISELKRFGHRNSCKALHIFQMTEKLAVAGIIDQRVYNLAGEILSTHKGIDVSSNSVKKLLSCEFSLLSDRPLLMLWRYASRQRKHGRQIESDEQDSELDYRTIGPSRDDDVKLNPDALAFTAIGSSSESMHSRQIEYLESSGDCTNYDDDDSNYIDTNEQSENSDNDCDLSDRALETSVDTDVAIKTLPPLQSLFADPSLPLVVDLGCGFGVSLLALAHRSYEHCRSPYDMTASSSNKVLFQGGDTLPYLDISTNTSGSFDHLNGVHNETKDATNIEVNYLGCDMSPSKVGYANSISSRWGMSGFCAFVTGDVDTVLQWLESEQQEQGSIAWIFLNFPTPYSVKLLHASNSSDAKISPNELIVNLDFLDVDSTNKSSYIAGNSQLPSDLADFMITPTLLRKAMQMLKPRSPPSSSRVQPAEGVHTPSRPGCLYIQSNVEDVAVSVRDMVETLNRQDNDVCSRFPTSPMEIPWVWSWGANDGLDRQMWVEERDGSAATGSLAGSRRQRLWEELGGRLAVGHGWLCNSPLPAIARTETEVMCQLNAKAVHRLLFLVD